MKKIATFKTGEGQKFTIAYDGVSLICISTNPALSERVSGIIDYYIGFYNPGSFVWGGEEDNGLLNLIQRQMALNEGVTLVKTYPESAPIEYYKEIKIPEGALI